MRRLGVHVRSIDRAPWIEDAEQRLGFRLPVSFRSLVTHFAFSPVELDRAELFGNMGDCSEFDLAVAMFRDAHMSPWLATHRLVHIGHPFLGDYDPICLEAMEGADPVVVRLN